MKYSIDEIDRMRAAIWELNHIHGHFVTPGSCEEFMSRQLAKIEDQLRTYMLNGTTPEELEEAAQSYTKKAIQNLKLPACSQGV